MGRKTKSYKRYLWTNESKPRRTCSRHKSEASTSNLGQASNTHNHAIFSFPSTENMEVKEAPSSISCGSSEDVSSSSESEGDDIPESISSDENIFENFSVKGNLYELNLTNANELLYESADITKLEAFVSILAYTIRFNLSKTSTDGLLQLLQVLLPQPSNLPRSKYLFFKTTVNNICEIHFYCPNCDSYVCQLSSEMNIDKCGVCSEPVNIQEFLKKGHYFLYMPLTYQIKTKLENQDLMSSVKNYKSKFQTSDGVYRDVMDGDLYHASEGLKDLNNISLQFNVDGVPIYKKSKYNIWPIQVLINELDPIARKENIMMCGLWFGPKKPAMNEFLIPFVEELNRLQHEGLDWKDAKGNYSNTKVFPLICTSDAPARSGMQNIKQYNGTFGCGFCEQEGERVVKGKGYCRAYAFTDSIPKRTFQNFVENAEIALNTGHPSKGVKGSSILMNLYPGFNMIDGFSPDYMHCALLGVTRQITTLFIESSGSVYSLSANDIQNLNARIKELKLPHEATRKLRTTKDIAFWKASEWRIFLLTSPVLLKKNLNSSVYRHWLFFVQGISILLETNISANDIKKAELCLKKFVCGVKEIYGIEEQSYNIHLLLHLTATVKAWGPLWAHSCFTFEDAIGKLKILHHSTKAVPLQISSAYTNKSHLEILVSKPKIKNPQIRAFLEEKMGGKHMTKKSTDINGCLLFGTGENKILLRHQQKSLHKLIGDKAFTEGVKSYKRMYYSSHIYSTISYCKKYIHSDYIVALNDDKCVEIHEIIVLDGEAYFLGEKIRVKNFSMSDPYVGSLCSNILTVSDEDYYNKGYTIAFKPCNIIRKYAALPVQGKGITYFIPLSIAEY